MSLQKALTLITPVLVNQVESLRNELNVIKEELIESKHEVFENIGSIHFARWVLIEPATNEILKPKIHLAFSSNYDVETEDHITALSSIAGAFIDRIYQYCEGYPTIITPATRKKYLKQWQVKNIGFYVGAPGRSLEQIRQESALQKHVRQLLHQTDYKEGTPLQIHKDLQRKVLTDPNFNWVKKPIKIPKVNYFGFILTIVVVILLFPILALWLVMVELFYERHDIPLGLNPSQVSEAHLRRLEAYEDLENQNQFSQVLTMKPGLVRLLTLKAFMLFSRQLIRTLFVKGKLMGIPTIHFARWVMIEGNKRMLFLSNFDGSWQQYLGDFIDKSGWGLTAIWSNSTGFPRTKFSFFGGAYDEEHFLAWSRYYEVPTQAWYSAYPHLSIKNINNNTMIRTELIKELNERQAANFLQRL